MLIGHAPTSLHVFTIKTHTCAQMTQERLKEELIMRRTELDKIDMLEDKIKAELSQLSEKSGQMQKQAGEFENVSGSWLRDGCFSWACACTTGYCACCGEGIMQSSS